MEFLRALAEQERLTANEALLGFARLLFAREADCVGSVTEGAITAMVAALAKSQAPATDGTMDWGDIAAFVRAADDSARPVVQSTTSPAPTPPPPRRSSRAVRKAR